MLEAKIAEVVRLTGEPFPKELTLRLKHMILSHHGTYEFGSPRLPMTPEAIALHHLDNLDAKVHEFARSIQDDPEFRARIGPRIPRGSTANCSKANRRDRRESRNEKRGASQNANPDPPQADGCCPAHPSSLTPRPSPCLTSNDGFWTRSRSRGPSRCGRRPWPAG